MISKGWFSKFREFTIRPVEFTSINNNATNGCTMTSNPFSSRMDNDISTIINWLYNITSSTKCTLNYLVQIEQEDDSLLVHHKWNTSLMGNVSKCLKIRYSELWVTNTFCIKHLCVFINGFTKIFWIVTVDKFCCDT
jgi:hypothetical protein